MFYCNKIKIRLFKSTENRGKAELIQAVNYSFTTKTYVVMATRYNDLEMRFVYKFQQWKRMREEDARP